MTWQPIESAPKDGRDIVCCWAGQPDSMRLLRWKTNPRIADARSGANHYRTLDVGDLLDSYFGDPTESDDYELAAPGSGPTHWHPIDAVPAG